MANGTEEVYQCESEPVPVLHHADKCCQLGELYWQMSETTCQMGDTILLASGDCSCVILCFHYIPLSYTSAVTWKILKKYLSYINKIQDEKSPLWQRYHTRAGNAHRKCVKEIRHVIQANSVIF